MSVVTEDRMKLFSEMEERFEKKDTDYFVELLDHEDYVIRTRATCILVDFGGEDKVPAPGYEMPVAPMLPVHQGWFATQSAIS